MTDRQFIDLTHYLDRIATAVESLARAQDPNYAGDRGASDRWGEKLREMNKAKRPAKKPAPSPPSGDTEDPERP